MIEEKIKGKESKKFDLIVSAHGLPMSIIFSGDPYEKHINSNFSALKIFLKERGLEFADISLAYQSKVGNNRWLEPNLVDKLRHPNSLNLLIFPISFTVDNSETLFELSIEHFEIAKKIGYNEYLVTKCLNDRDEFVDFITKKIKEVFYSTNYHHNL